MQRAPTVALLLVAESESDVHARDDDDDGDGGAHASSPSPVVRRIRRQVVARGLARHYGELKARETSPQKRVTRAQRQQAIIDEYRRKRTLHEERMKQVDATLQRSQQAKVETPVVPEQRGNGLSKQRVTSLRRLPDGPSLELQPTSTPSRNQLEHEETAIDAFAVASTSPLKSELMTQLGLRPFSPPKEEQQHQQQQQPQTEARHGASDASTAQTLCEIQLTRDIHLREHTVEQIHSVAATLEGLATELSSLAQRKAKLEAAALAAVTAASSASSSASSASSSSSSSSSSGAMNAAAKRGSATLSGPVALPLKRPESGNDKATVAKESVQREKELRECDARTTELAVAARQRMAQLERLIDELRALTVAIVDAIVAWRRLRRRRVALSNRETRECFAWPPRRTRNYLLALDDDLRDLFPSAAMAARLGADAVYNALLLPRRALDELLSTSTPTSDSTTTTTTTTFLTQRDASSSTSSAERWAALVRVLSPSGEDPAALSNDGGRVSAADARRCLQSLRDERAFELAQAAAQQHETRRRAQAYDPFDAIKRCGGVDETLAMALEREAPHVDALATQLRRRQQDVRRDEKPTAASPSPARVEPTPTPALVVNPTRLRRLLARSARRATRPSTACWCCRTPRGVTAEPTARARSSCGAPTCGGSRRSTRARSSGSSSRTGAASRCCATCRSSSGARGATSCGSSARSAGSSRGKWRRSAAPRSSARPSAATPRASSGSRSSASSGAGGTASVSRSRPSPSSSCTCCSSKRRPRRPRRRRPRAPPRRGGRTTRPPPSATAAWAKSGGGSARRRCSGGGRSSWRSRRRCTRPPCASKARSARTRRGRRRRRCAASGARTCRRCRR
ncbi:hypothetical protein PINS_up010072 [Pythium insidiosum]|nr:hypothetical protein PINS_up010072 [Pythium insidiosum]